MAQLVLMAHKDPVLKSPHVLVQIVQMVQLAQAQQWTLVTRFQSAFAQMHRHVLQVHLTLALNATAMMECSVPMEFLVLVLSNLDVIVSTVRPVLMEFQVNAQRCRHVCVPMVLHVQIVM
jgi:hypothetical protein